MRLKERKEIEVSTLRMLSAAIFNKEKEKRYRVSKEKPELLGEELEKESQLTDEETIAVISSEIKKRKEAILKFSAYAEGYGGPAVAPQAGAEAGKKEKIESFINKEKKEIEVLQKYLPEQLSEEEIKKLAKEAVAAYKASLAPEEREKVGIKDMGRVMAELMPKIKGKADGSLVNKIVKELLTTKNE